MHRTATDANSLETMSLPELPSASSAWLVLPRGKGTEWDKKDFCFVLGGRTPASTLEVLCQARRSVSHSDHV